MSSGNPDPERTEIARIAELGEAEARDEDEPMGDDQPDYDARETGISEERRPMGPPLGEGPGGPPPALDERDDEPPVDPA